MEGGGEREGCKVEERRVGYLRQWRRRKEEENKGSKMD
jgi:hypothetical protein